MTGNNNPASPKPKTTDAMAAEAEAYPDGRPPHDHEAAAPGDDEAVEDYMGEEEELDDLPEAKGLTIAQHAELLAKWGPNEIPEDVEPCWLSFAKRFWGPMPGMIWAAILVEGANQEWIDFVVLLLLQLLNGLVGFIEERNAGNAVAALKNTLRPQCRVQRDGEWKIQDARDLVPGDLISLKLGDVVPADGVVVETDSIDVDQSALTGESLPVTVFVRGKVVMGSSVKRGVCLVIVEATGANTFFGKAAALMGGRAPPSRFQQVLYLITLVLMFMSIGACAIIFADLLLAHGGMAVLNALAVVVIILVASIPIATQVVATSTMAVGARLMAKKKAIVARLGAIEELAGMTVLCSDKTGTLTKNILSLREPVLVSDMGEEEFTLFSGFACHLEEGTQDAIDTCILNSIKERGMEDRLNSYKQLKLVPFNPTDKRASALMEDATGKRFKVLKGAPQTVLRMATNGPQVAKGVSMAIQSLADRGFRSLGVSVSYTDKGPNNPGTVEDPEDSWIMLGLLAMFDPPRDDTKATIATAISMGVEVKMVTGDHLAIARETCRELGMGANILGVDYLEHPGSNVDELILNAHGFAEVMPEHKYQIVHAIQASGAVVGMTGDGVNDAPALKRANIGIAVQGATDAAKAAADIVLIEPGLSVIIDAIIVSRKIFQRMRNYCIYRIAATIQLLFFFFFSILFIDPRGLARDYEYANFTLPVISLVLITVLNDVTMIAIAYDKVVAGKDPQDWNLMEVSIISTVLGAVPCLSSLILLILSLLSHNSEVAADGEAWYSIMLGSRINEAGHYYLSVGEIETVMYLKIAIADFLTLFCARTNWFIWERAVGRALSVSFFAATAASTILALAWPFPESEESIMESISFKTAAVVWAYNLVWMILQDIAKVAAYKALEKAHARIAERKRRLAEQEAAAKIATNMTTDDEMRVGGRARRRHSSTGSLNRAASVLDHATTMEQININLAKVETQLNMSQARMAALNQLIQEVHAMAAAVAQSESKPE